MATKTKKQTQTNNQNQTTTNQEVDLKTLGRDVPIIEYLKKLIEAHQQFPEKVQTLVPCLYGESGTGKTQRVRALAEELGMDLRVVLLHSMLPEEILGLPRVIDGKTVWSLPDWVDTEKPVVYFFDELDKVREEELGTILTLFADKRVRDYVLPKGSVIIAGMQPIDDNSWQITQTGRALIARMVFVTTNGREALNYLQSKYGWDLEYIHARTDITPPLIDPTPRQIEYAINLYRKLPKELWVRTLYGIFPEQFTEIFINNMGPSQIFATDQELAKLLNEDIKLINDIDLMILLDKGGPIMEFCNPEVVAEVETRILRNCTPEEWLKFNQKRYDYLKERVEQSPDKTLEIINGASVEDLYEAYRKRIPQLIDELNQRKGEKNA